MSERGQYAVAGVTIPKVVIARTYQASAEELWELWTTKEGFESWWGPVGFRVDVHTLEARAGGPLRYDMIAEAPYQIEAMKRMGRPASYETRGRFMDMKLYERLAIKQVIDFLPGVRPYESTMLVELFPVDDFVRMEIALDPLHDDAFTKFTEIGFVSQLSKLDDRF